MEKAEIQKTIEYYDLYDPKDGRLLIRKNFTKTQEELEKIKAAKPEILAYFAAERETFSAELRRKEETFRAIPGVKEVSEARAEWAEFWRKFNSAMDSESSILPVRPASNLKAIEAANPLAVWALKVASESTGCNFKIAEIAGRAYDALCAGENPEEVKATYDSEIAEYTQQHLWD